MGRAGYIAFEGPIAAGKTTLAKLLAAHLEADLLLENFDGNEFLPDFYAEPKRWALPMQLGFLLARHSQLRRTPPEGKWCVADHTFWKDAIFANILLPTGREQRLYRGVSAALSGSYPAPTLLVYLDANDDVLLNRIRERGRVYEQSIDADYLKRIRESYETHLTERKVNLIRVSTDSLDLRDKDQLIRVYRQITDAVTDST